MKRLLIVDNEPTIVFALQRYFTRKGFSVDCAAELEEAEALVTYTRYDLVIVDLSLTANGSTEGLEIIRYVRSITRGSSRLILLTAYGTPMVEREAYRRGADAVLQKPRPLAEIAQVAAQLTGDAA
jgi:DNA-binding response OmpR family regulator